MTIEQLSLNDIHWLKRKIPIDRIEYEANRGLLPWRTYTDLRKTWNELGNQLIFKGWLVYEP